VQNCLRLLRASSSTLARDSKFIPWANARSCLAAIVLASNSVGPYDSLVLSLIIHLVGQFDPIIQNEIGPSKVLCEIAYRLLRASSSTLARDSKFIPWANARSCLAAIVLASNSVGPYDSLVLSLIMHLVGQFDPIIQNEIGPSEVLCEIAYRLLRASSSTLARDSKFIPWVNTRSCSVAIVLASNGVGQHNSLASDLIMHLMGQFKPIIQNEIGPSKGLCEIAYRLLRASSSTLARDSKFIPWVNTRSCSAAILLASNNVGPYSSLVQHHIVT